jgi:predicted DNA-binding protein YlxM (UPF0122 family)
VIKVEEMKEIWKDVKNYEGLYQVSNLGRVRSLPKKRKNSKGTYIIKEKIMKPSIGSTGYYFVNLTKECNLKIPRKIHRLVAQTFIPIIKGKTYINHIDGNKLNNNIDNLEWCTNQENIIHAYETGLNKRFTIDQKELQELYINKGLGISNIANIKNVSFNVIERELKRQGFKLRNMSEADTKYFITKEFLEKELENKTQKQIASEIGCDASLISKYKKKFNL